MLADTHLIGGAVAGLGVATVTTNDPVLLVGAALLGALIPDIDHASSTMGRKVKLLSGVIRSVFGHRTFTHSILFLLLLAWLMAMLPIHETIILGILVGMVSHYILDAVTKDGIKLFYPFPITFRIPLYIRTGGKMENVVKVALSVLGIYWGMDVLGLS